MKIQDVYNMVRSKKPQCCSHKIVIQKQLADTKSVNFRKCTDCKINEKDLLSLECFNIQSVILTECSDDYFYDKYYCMHVDRAPDSNEKRLDTIIYFQTQFSSLKLKCFVI